MTKKEIQNRLTELGLQSLYGYRRELKALPQLLADDENLNGITSGVYQGRRWLLAVTHKRMIFVTANTLSGVEVKSFDLSQLVKTSNKKGFLFAAITLNLQEEEITLQHIAKQSLPSLTAALERNL